MLIFLEDEKSKLIQFPLLPNFYLMINHPSSRQSFIEFIFITVLLDFELVLRMKGQLLFIAVLCFLPIAFAQTIAWTAVFFDDFNRASLGNNYITIGGPIPLPVINSNRLTMSRFIRLLIKIDFVALRNQELLSILLLLQVTTFELVTTSQYFQEYLS